MKTFNDNSEGKTSIHRPKTMITKYLILAISFGEKILNFHYNNCMLLLDLFRFLLNFAKNIFSTKNNAKNRAK